MLVQPLGREDPLEEGLAAHSSILAWRIPMGRGTWWAIVHGVAESDRTERLSTARHIHIYGFPGGSVRKNLPTNGFDPWVGKIPWRRKWQPAAYSCLENPHGQRSLVGYSPRGRKESNTTKAT